jgi:hypothetical protein
MSEPTTHHVRVGFTVTRTESGRSRITCECLDNPHGREEHAPILRSGVLGFDCREGVTAEQAAQLARLMSDTLSHLTHTPL